MNFQRDKFIEEIYQKAKKDKNIYFISADFGAPALDQFRKNLKNQFIHAGISEQNAVNVAAGLALKNKTVFLYAMAPFITLRCLEQHKCCSAIMNLPINTIVAGVGIGYADSGPTHYTTEDISSLRNLVNSHIYTASDTIVSKHLANYLIKNKTFSFIRLDRDPQKDIYSPEKISQKDIELGYKFYQKNTKNKYLVISHGYQFRRIIEAQKKQKIKKSIDFIDLIRCKPFPKKLLPILKNYKKIVVIDEQFIGSSILSIIGELNLIHHLNLNVKNFCLNENYIFENGGREKLLNNNGLNINKIIKYINNL